MFFLDRVQEDALGFSLRGWIEQTIEDLKVNEKRLSEEAAGVCRQWSGTFETLAVKIEGVPNLTAARKTKATLVTAIIENRKSA